FYVLDATNHTDADGFLADLYWASDDGCEFLLDTHSLVFVYAESECGDILSLYVDFIQETMLSNSSKGTGEARLFKSNIILYAQICDYEMGRIYHNNTYMGTSACRGWRGTAFKFLLIVNSFDVAFDLNDSSNCSSFSLPETA
ncbi:hypothetical protein OSTOST_01975, partial [Ostertagia ostertagi]